MSSASKKDIADLFKKSGSALGLDEASSDILIHNLNAGNLPMCQLSPFTDEEKETDDFRLIHFGFDGSSSMDSVGDDLIASVNDVVIPGLLGGAADQVGAIRVGGLVFNHTVRSLWQSGGDSGFYPLTQFPKLTKADYRPSGSTALNQAVLDSVTATTAMALQVRRRTGTNPESVIAFFSDGANNQDPKDSDDVFQVLSKLSPELFTLVFVGFETFERVDFNAIALSLGFRDVLDSKLQPGETVDDQRKRFRNVMKVFSGSLTKRASQSLVGSSMPAKGSGTGFWK